MLELGSGLVGGEAALGQDLLMEDRVVCCLYIEEGMVGPVRIAEMA